MKVRVPAARLPKQLPSQFPIPFFVAQSRRPSRALEVHSSPQSSYRPLSITRSLLSNAAPTTSTSKPNPAHWLSTTHTRIGHCITFGLSRSQLALCSRILSILSKEWRFLLAGREGYVASKPGVLARKVVWGEMDSMGHVNNVVYVRWAETGRVEWLCGLGMDGDVSEKVNGSDKKNGRRQWAELMTPRGEKGVILKSIKVDYKFPVEWPDRVTVFHKLRSSPASILESADPSSFMLDVLILSEVYQRPAARCEEDVVVYNYNARKKVSIEGFINEGFERTWKEQEETKLRAEKRIEEVEVLLRQLEQDSWDREGAVEDNGPVGKT